MELAPFLHMEKETHLKTTAAHASDLSGQPLLPPPAQGSSGQGWGTHKPGSARAPGLE